MSKKLVEPVHTVADLRQMQSLSLGAKVRMTQARIRAWYEYWYGDVYVSFSGGKDSTVLLHIVRDMYPEVPAVYVDTGLEYPEVREHALSVDNVTVLSPMRWNKKLRKYERTNFKEVLFEYGYPIISKEVAECVQDGRKTLAAGTGKKTYRLKRLYGELKDKDGKKSKFNCEKWRFLLDAPFDTSNLCCDVMKKNPAHIYERETGRKPFIGTLADESAVRLQKWLHHGCNAFDSDRPKSQPLSFWKEEDILEYLLRNEIDFAECYGDIIYDGEHYYNTGVARTGCMFCGFGVHLEKEPNRFQKMKETHPKRYEYCMKPKEEGGLGFAEVLDYIGVNYK